jgi:hypothetical protein
MFDSWFITLIPGQNSSSCGRSGQFVFVLHSVFSSCYRLLDETCSQCECLRPRVQAIFSVPAASFSLSLCRSGSFLSRSIFLCACTCSFSGSTSIFLGPVFFSRGPRFSLLQNFFRCRWSQRLGHSSAAHFSSSSPTNFLSLSRALSTADLAARFARRPLFFGFLGLRQFSCAGN